MDLLHCDRVSLGTKNYSLSVSLAQDNNDEPTKNEKMERGNNDELNRGIDFAVLIMKDIEEIPGSHGMRAIHGVVDLETDGQWDVVIRSVAQPVRVCAVGTPGIGKSTSTAFLIRMLLQEKHTVVYRIASEDYLWEFAWKNEVVPLLPMLWKVRRRLQNLKPM